jgi:phosphoribosylformylglycinamidine synthase
MSGRVGVVVFPGSNCEHDVVEAIEGLGGEAELVWHGARSVSRVDSLVLPGGFAHGDYLRPGALARFSPVMDAVRSFAADGGPVLGVCNGFQILTEAGLLPGALQKNHHLKFLCTTVSARIERSRSFISRLTPPGTVLRLPINHFEGNYICRPETLAQLRADERIVARYCDNPNGSIDDIAGITNEAGNVVGLMPHPERAYDNMLGSADGAVLLRSLLDPSGGQWRPTATEAGVASGPPGPAGSRLA